MDYVYESAGLSHVGGWIRSFRRREILVFVELRRAFGNGDPGCGLLTLLEAQWAPVAISATLSVGHGSTSYSRFSHGNWFRHLFCEVS